MMLQKEHKAWVDAWYPNQPPSLPAAGLVEEAAELLACVAKSERIRKYGAEMRYEGKDWGAEIIDAIGDCGIYACSLCNAMGWDYHEIERRAGVIALWLMKPSETQLESACCDLVKAAAEVFSECDVSSLLFFVVQLHVTSRHASVSYADAVSLTWKKVQKRCRS